MTRIGRVALAAVTLLLLVMMLVPAQPDRDAARSVPGTTYSAGPSGSRALFLLLPALGMEVSHLRRPAYASQQVDATLWLLGHAPVGRQNQHDLTAFLNRGGTVITLPENVALLLATPEMIPATPKRSARHIQVLSDAPLRLRDDPMALIAGPAPAWTLAETDAHEPVIAAWHVGKGTLVSLGAPEIVENDRIGLGSNGLFVAHLAMRLGHRHVFDEVKTGFAETSMWALATRLPYRWGLLQAAVAGLLGVWMLAGRRYPIRSSPSLQRRRTMDHVDAVARLWQSGRDAGLPLRAILRAADERARVSAASTEQGRSWLARITRTKPALAARARAVWEHAEVLAEASNTEVAAARAVAAQLQQIEREAQPWHHR